MRDATKRYVSGRAALARERLASKTAEIGRGARDVKGRVVTSLESKIEKMDAKTQAIRQEYERQ